MLLSCVDTCLSLNEECVSEGTTCAAPKLVRTLAPAELLFHDGERRGDVWRIVEGSLCHFISWDGERREVIEFAFVGDLIGFGHLDRYVSSASAMTPAKLVRVSDDEFMREIKSDPRLAMRLAATGDREFEVLRLRSLASVSNGALPRAAAFLSALAQLGAAEGRPEGFIPDDAVSDWSAGQIGLSVSAMRAIVEGLERQGVVRPVNGGHLVVDAQALDSLAAA